ncbi:TetR family transcriptional regulator [Streptacidiphilus sp. P02-A3a]|uniref:acyl-CoA-like ligand-binding transcription factor n=1 Tax=Streptacidiphilus sp. P02-A3a TaxID=2704468 RepID=UPI0015F79F16|nr:TetR family transcriptional regulator [Streptacidiphilus sp. P02-A3a]QMU67657.1 TetR family transcriptional regulator [Streptacidiphilus sp. P02-A3a]
MTSAPPPIPAADIEEVLAAPLGLRERKKLKTRRAIRAAAFRRFAAQGYEGTTVDQIAADADVSPSTFFRYFPTKEDLVITDDYDPIMEAELRSRPTDESILESLLQAMVQPLRAVLANEREDLLLRARLLQGNPAVRARSHVEMNRTREMLLRVFAERTGGTPEDLGLRVQIAALQAVSGETVEYWAEHEGKDDLIQLLEQALGAIATGLTPPAPTPTAAVSPRERPRRSRGCRK